MSSDNDFFEDDYLSEDPDNHARPDSGIVQQTVFSCAFCGSDNFTFVDPSQGLTQQYVEDCQTCCRPNLLQVGWNEWEREWMITAEPE